MPLFCVPIKFGIFYSVREKSRKLLFGLRLFFTKNAHKIRYAVMERKGEYMLLKMINNTLAVSVTGDMDHHNVGLMRSEIDRAIREKPVKNVVFDLSKLDFMDSSGVGLMLGRYKLVKELGGSVFIAGAKPAVERIINVSGLHKIIPIYESMDKAIKTVCGTAT